MPNEEYPPSERLPLLEAIVIGKLRSRKLNVAPLTAKAKFVLFGRRRR